MSKFRWKGQFMTEKQSKKKWKQVELGKKRKKEVSEEEVQENDGSLMTKRRVVDLEVMAAHLYCSNCNEILSLQYIEKEIGKGLGSIFHVRCHNCLLVNLVPSGSQHVSQTRKIFDVNSKVALGALHAGLGYTSINKLFQVLDIPFMTACTFKRYEREVGPTVEEVAKESCEDATELERLSTIKNLESLQKNLPKELQSDFLIKKSATLVSSHESMENQIILDTSDASMSLPDRENTSQFNREQDVLIQETVHRLSNAEKTVHSETTQELEATELESTNINFEDVVRLFVSYDMGYSKRGSGHQYDSLNGYAAIIGAQSGRVLDYTTRNRKCRLCDLGYSQNTHDCRLNFHGSAKAMEADAAVELATGSRILREKNVEVGVFISDNDSSSIRGVRDASDHTVLKQSDRNHTTKGVKSLLYKTANKKEITGLTTDAISYLHRCFVYALAQNEGNSEKMSTAVKNIPYHAFDMHDNCGEWCGFGEDPENYQHTTVLSKQFKNDNLFKELVSIFERLGNNAEKFSCPASSQANESLNSTMSKKAPKAICYSLSESSDYRFACAVGQKNKGEGYVQHALKKLRMSPGRQLSKHVERTMKSHYLRSKKAKQPEFKARRQLLKKMRTQLRNSKSQVEDHTYESHVELLTLPATDNSENDIGTSNLLDLQSNLHFCDKSVAVVFFDLETAGLKSNSDVIQIAMKYGELSFAQYIEPTKPIPSQATKVHRITNSGRDMFLNGKKVFSQPLRIIMGQLLEFLTDLGKPCILVAHNCAFDAPRLVRIINETSLQDEFSKVIESFVDTLPLFRKKFPKEKCNLGILAAKTFHLNGTKAHDALHDVLMLENIVFHNFTFDELTANKIAFTKFLEGPKNFNSLAPLTACISKQIRSRMADEGMNYNNLFDKYRAGEMEITKFLEKKIDGKKTVIKTKKVLTQILKHFELLMQ